MEIRSFGENAAPKLLDERMIEGYAIVFERESRVMYDLEKKRFFIEVIKSGAISDELLRSCDIKALLEHNKQKAFSKV
ncbi:HK97 family phage prohead protease [Bacteroides fragilis]|nr:HK97 family phage prohead protease [Bacteroides fragilis]